MDITLLKSLEGSEVSRVTICVQNSFKSVSHPVSKGSGSSAGKNLPGPLSR